MRKAHRVVLNLGLRQLRARRDQRRVAAQHVFDRRLVRCLDVLRDVRNAWQGRRLDRSAVYRQFAEDCGKQRRFARTIGTDQADPLARRRDKRDVAV